MLILKEIKPRNQNCSSGVRKGGGAMADDREHSPTEGLNPNALTLANAARILSSAYGEPITEDMIQADLAAGAPANTDGTINLVHYAAWLVKEWSGAD
ncbi:MAG: hypothetical protein ACK4RK_16435 [Gemmataceae bacterium]